MYNEQLNKITFDEQGLVPAIIQDVVTGKVLTHAYMNKESLEKTLATNETWFYSRKRQQLWHKGETSGNRQQVKEIRYDCDADALLVTVEPMGPACHTGKPTCFHHTLKENDAAEQMTPSELADLIRKRRKEAEEGSYTTYLFTEGIDKILKKVGEETSEVIIGAKNNSHDEMVWEIADLTYHTLVLMELMGVSITDIQQALAERHAVKEGTKHA
ncbi:bifunctional phosphoribosyl-AMP cyclohydrolase/phosphoribosyl-ATP diphosphatase HisIE [Lentibacillus cibarius]|uniref:Histidine biosynthesis bifunctional protein HisIE n=1 Tax=Lentibacillus cibarius TaxID=2583219 RepID=A0A549YHF1_9BACI|nr:bifunctional phosphoribosyl-AMP cyclohydrolase/phosphoribosyl-ATP diphosphatase HisIE [Lentibacillus cibarius]TMN22516.1 bifunctional phosphoribosyl-AMP cyclohydrolase/phosphoribosyl-ATP diphosphatase HisIE [Lentibacillus cibarius]TRM11312.1 bifunctional phosphoribosyl-AMP cyclohydrolase/phosphoribosyl-ATP diphosphatase HisIE [Lentibacillus cibarius]